MHYEASSAAFEGSGEGREGDEWGRDFAELEREEPRVFGDPALEDCSDFGLAVRDGCLELPPSDFCDFPDAGLEDEDFTEAGRDDGFWPEGGRDETCCPDGGLSGSRGSSGCSSGCLTSSAGCGFGCCSIMDSVSPWMILWAASRCFLWLLFTANQSKYTCISNTLWVCTLYETSDFTSTIFFPFPQKFS